MNDKHDYDKFKQNNFMPYSIWSYLYKYLADTLFAK